MNTSTKIKAIVILITSWFFSVILLFLSFVINIPESVNYLNFNVSHIDLVIITKIISLLFFVFSFLLTVLFVYFFILRKKNTRIVVYSSFIMIAIVVISVVTIELNFSKNYGEAFDEQLVIYENKVPYSADLLSLYEAGDVDSIRCNYDEYKLFKNKYIAINCDSVDSTYSQIDCSMYCKIDYFTTNNKYMYSQFLKQIPESVYDFDLSESDGTIIGKSQISDETGNFITTIMVQRDLKVLVLSLTTTELDYQSNAVDTAKQYFNQFSML